MSSLNWIDILLAAMAMLVMIMVAGGNKFPAIKIPGFISGRDDGLAKSSSRATIILLTFLTLSGFGSGLLSGYLAVSKDGMSWPGVIFGALLSVCLLALGKFRSRWWFPVFPMVSAGAYILAIYAIVLPELAVRAVGRSMAAESLGLNAPVRWFIAGFCGAAVLFGAGIWPFLLSDMKAKRAMQFGVCWAIAGGILAIFGWNCGPSLGLWLCSWMNTLECESGPKIDRSGYSLYLIWQTGMALLLAIMLLLHQNKLQQVEQRGQQ